MATHRSLSVRRRPSSSSSEPQNTFLFALLILISTYHVVLCSGDKNADNLLKFKTGLENSGSLGSWSNATTPCNGKISNWKGVDCNKGQVYGLILDNMGLSGTIDVDSLEPFSSTLRSLSFKNNNFQGPMPDWRKLKNLKMLYLSQNHFSGDIPEDSFQGFDRLKIVYLDNNEFTGMIPSSLSSVSLTELSLDNNKFSGPIPEFKKDLRILNLSNNQLQGPIPESLTHFDASSFSGNSGLCGKPMGSKCKNSRALNIVLIIIIAISVKVSLGLLIIVLLKMYRARKNKTYDDSVILSVGKPISRARLDDDFEANDTQIVTKKVEHNPNRLTFVKEDREEFDLQDLLKSSAEVLGSGNFGSSFKATLNNGHGFVVKRFNQMNNIEKEDFLEHMRRLGRLEHPNLLPIVAYFYRKEEKLLVFDHVYNGSLASVLHGNPSTGKPSLDWTTRLGIVKGVTQGLLYLQTNLPSITVAHGHLKSSNVLLDKNLNPRLMDYALIPVVNLDQAHNLLVSYKSPEYAQTGRVYKKTDVWCLGILILEILTGKIPTNYVIAQYSGYDSNLASWIDYIVTEDSLDVIDKQMDYPSASKGAILKLLRIGAACCREDLNERMDLMEAAEMIEEVNERDY